MSAEAVHYRSTSKNVVYFGKLEARARETKAEITELRPSHPHDLFMLKFV